MDSRASNDVKESMTVHESEMDGSGHHHPELTPAFEAGKETNNPKTVKETRDFCLFEGWVGGKNHIYKCTKVYIGQFKKKVKL